MAHSFPYDGNDRQVFFNEYPDGVNRLYLMVEFLTDGLLCLPCSIRLYGEADRVFRGSLGDQDDIDPMEPVAMYFDFPAGTKVYDKKKGSRISTGPKFQEVNRNIRPGPNKSSVI